MKLLLFFAFLLSLPICTIAANTKIEALVAELSDSPLWMNGMSPTIDLPFEASPAQVVDRCLQMTGFDSGHIKHYEIRATEKVAIPPDSFTAVLIQSDLGEKIILMRYEGNKVGWWTRVFDSARKSHLRVFTGEVSVPDPNTKSHQ